MFAIDQAEILSEFDLMGKGEDPLQPLMNELTTAFFRLNLKIRLWEVRVFQGDSSGYLKRIMEEQGQV